MRTILQQHLRVLDGVPYVISECRIVDVFRTTLVGPCWLTYDVHFEAAAERGATIRVTGVLYRDARKAKLAFDELERAWAGDDSGGAAATRPFFSLPELSMLLVVFPYDPRLPALASLMLGPPPAIEPLLLAPLGPGDWRAEGWDVEPSRYRFGKIATLRLSARALAASSYAKIYYHQDKGARARQAFARLRQRQNEGARFTVPAPLAYDADLRTLFLEDMRGTSLDALFRRGDDAIAAVRRTAGALAELHLSDVAVAVPRLDLQNELGRLERSAELLRSARPDLASPIDQIVRAAFERLVELPPAPTLGDFKAAHVLVDRDRLALIDVDQLAGSDPVLDVARFMAHLWSEAPEYAVPRERTRAVAMEFAEEYFVHAPRSWRVRLPVRYAMALVVHIAARHWRQEPDWPDQAEAFVTEAMTAVTGRWC
ncbi:MAG: aminoglycoside phosphotransferase family protein [Chloroflexota bacterium]|nr:aminoglycoside phosphotransferase family protein [Chloroflexota bacterium]